MADLYQGLTAFKVVTMVTLRSFGVSFLAVANFLVSSFLQKIANFLSNYDISSDFNPSRHDVKCHVRTHDFT